jgi:hypothetical protein
LSVCGAPWRRRREFRLFPTGASLASSTPVRGFALVDVLVAAALVSTGLLATVHLMAGAIAANAAARRYAMATLLASQKLEELRAFAVGAPVDVVEYADADGTLVAVGGGAPPGTAYVRRSTIQPLPSAPGRLMVVRVVVQPSAGRAGEAVSLATVATVRP